MNTTMLHAEHADEAMMPSSLAQRVVYGASLIAVLPVAMAASLSGWRWQPWPPGGSGYQSVLTETMVTARNVTAIAFSVK